MKETPETISSLPTRFIYLQYPIIIVIIIITPFFLSLPLKRRYPDLDLDVVLLLVLDLDFPLIWFRSVLGPKTKTPFLRINK